MSQDITLICPRDVQISDLSNILKERWPSPRWFTRPGQTSPVLQIQEEDRGISYLTIEELAPAEEVAREYEEWYELPLKIRSQLCDKKYYTLTFNDERLFMKAIMLILSRLSSHMDDTLLDNGYGVLIPARTFMDELARDPAWDWRHGLQSITLVCPRDMQISELSNILKERWPSHSWFTRPTKPTLSVLQIEEESQGISYLSIEESAPAEEVVREYEKRYELPLKILSQLCDKKYYTLAFNDDRLFMKAIMLILSQLSSQLDDIWLDNGYDRGLIPARTFMDESERNPAWDWRQFQLVSPDVSSTIKGSR